MTIWENGKYVPENQFRVYSGETVYKHVYEYRAGFQTFFEANLEINGENVVKTFDNLKDAAKYVDLQLIKEGKNPVNLLKPISK